MLVLSKINAKVVKIVFIYKNGLRFFVTPT